MICLKIQHSFDKEAIVFINQDVESLNLLSRLKALKDGQCGEVINAPQVKMDNKDFGIGAQILHNLNLSKIKLMSNSNQSKWVGLIGYGLEIVGHVYF